MEERALSNNKVVPISSFVIKIASRCNLNCSYCYEYNMGDESWKAMPKYMPESTMIAVLNRIKEHATRHDFSNIAISLHGGEPLLVGHTRLVRYLDLIGEILPTGALSVGCQTNGILIDEEFVQIFNRFNLSVGISLDSAPDSNDRKRYYHNGKGSGKEVENALSLLRGNRAFSGILSVIDLEASPVDTWRYLASFDPPVMDFLFPHAHWGIIKNETDLNQITKYGEWLIEIFDDWFVNGFRPDIRIRFFEEIIYRVFGHKGSLESLGLEEVSLVTIGLNGQYEQVDTMKSVFPGAHNTSFFATTHSLDEVLEHEHIKARQTGISALSGKCRTCPIVFICGGGYYPHRYSPENGFMNPSVYCSALTLLINHIDAEVRKKSKKKVSTE
jgi:uncharacterized protein